jgi:hypothetical protein
MVDCTLFAVILLDLKFDLEDEDSMLFRKVDKLLPDYTAPYSRRQSILLISPMRTSKFLCYY